MRFLLFIPVLILFLSNVPFVQKIPMQQAIAMMEENESCAQHQQCSRETEDLDASCHIQEAGCEQSCGDESTPVGTPDDHCCQQSATNCVCIVCFQYSAPVHSLTEYVFCSSSPVKARQSYLVGHIKDTHIGAPWQPPDLV